MVSLAKWQDLAAADKEEIAKKLLKYKSIEKAVKNVIAKYWRGINKGMQAVVFTEVPGLPDRDALRQAASLRINDKTRLANALKELTEQTKIPAGGRVHGAPAAKPNMSGPQIAKLQDVSEKLFPLTRGPYFIDKKLFKASGEPASSSAPPPAWIERAIESARKLMAPDRAPGDYSLSQFALVLFYAHHLTRTGTPAEGKGELYLSGMPKSGHEGYPSEMKAILNWLKYPEYAPTELPSLMALQQRA